jgi:hypothetical protein
VVVVGYTVATHFGARQSTTRSRMSEIIETQARMDELRSQYGTIAFWDGSPGWRLGAASFHFWGSYRYANGYFDNELLAAFHGTTWLHLRDIPELVRMRRETTPPQRPTALPANPPPVLRRPIWKAPFRMAHRLIRALDRSRPKFPSRTLECYGGESEQVVVGLFAFREASVHAEVYEPLGWTRSDLHQFFVARYGPLDLWTESIGGCEWVFMGRRASMPPD